MNGVPSARNGGPWLGMFVAGESNPGGRKHMEDYIVLKSETDTKGQAFFAVFDGHGGKEAAKYARDNLWASIKASDGFESGDPVKVAQAIAAGFVKTHEDMWKVRDSWKKTKGGDSSTSGTTVACAIVQQDRMYVANVGDSTVVLGKANPNYGEPGEPEVVAEVITRDHKPEDKKEKRRIEALGGNVSMSNKGVMRVVWERTRPVTTSKTGEKYQVDKIPFLSVARSLGDLWSVTKNNEYLVSPIPDVYVHYFDLTKDKFVVLASDGLWNMLKPQEVVESVYSLCKSGVADKVEASKAAHKLVDQALERWNKRNLTADNISALIGFFREYKKEDSFKEDDSKSTVDIHLSDVDEGIDLEVSTPIPSEDEQLHGNTHRNEDMVHTTNEDCDSLQASYSWRKPPIAKQKLGKRPTIQSDCLSSPKKPSIITIPSQPQDILST